MTKLSEDFKAAFTSAYLSCVAVASADEVKNFLNDEELGVEYQGQYYTSLMDAYLVFYKGMEFADSLQPHEKKR